ncbi:Fur family transcriptional regulator [Wukongibacter sp. M2B1]|uniref:Fur family transcriptional regulator n=1 Tax=Wukongibacter sp. M2B1 TaxID=3088895 RepID=UPI003D7A5103
MDYRIQRIEKILKQNDYRLTIPRKEIIKLFVNNKHEHFKIEEVYDLLKGKNISLPTVYRTIEIFKINGIIKETIIDKVKYYELGIFSEKSVHVHLKCIKCGNIFDYLNTESILNLLDERNRIEQQHDIVIDDIYSIFYGVCEECRR